MLRFNFHWFLLCVFVSVVSISFIALAKPAPSAVLLEASGGGATTDLAKERALANLGTQVLVRLQSHTLSTMAVHRINSTETVEQQSMDTVSMDSRLFFQGVTYSSVKKVRGDGYTAVAQLTSKAYKATVSGLEPVAYTADVDALTRVQQYEAQEKLSMLVALLQLPEGQGLIVNDDILLHKARFVQGELSKRMGAYGWITFAGDPRFTDASVQIDGRAYPVFSKIFLSAGRHAYTVRYNGFHPMMGTASITSGQSVRIPLRLVPLLPSPVPIALVLDSVPLPMRSMVHDFVMAQLAPYGFIEKSSASRRLVVSVSIQNAQVLDFFSQKVMVNMVGQNSTDSYMVSETKTRLVNGMESPVDPVFLQELLDMLLGDFLMSPSFSFFVAVS